MQAEDFDGVSSVVANVHFGNKKDKPDVVLEVSTEMPFCEFVPLCLDQPGAYEEANAFGEVALTIACAITGDSVEVETLGDHYEVVGTSEFDLILRPFTKEELKLLSAEEEYEHAKRALKEAEEEHRLSKRTLKRTKTEPL
jgi:hypothetical protein